MPDAIGSYKNYFFSFTAVPSRLSILLQLQSASIIIEPAFYQMLSNCLSAKRETR
jgi:hypothetical protein